ncbi:MAG: magnesium chelatase [bacterium]|nr:magnesium chelatase [bacterium]
MNNKPETLGDLKSSEYTVRPVKDEMRENLIRKLKSGEELFPGIIGYEDTVIPQVVNAVLSKHDFIFLGLRGQAKSRILRALTELLDEEIPIVKGSEINDDPFSPVSKISHDMFIEMGDDMPVEWLPREKRYAEKLATPDVTIADLIGDIDPIKAASQKLHYSHEGTIHYGIIPRTNRGIFAINELPDLQQRIQVGLLNIMQEKDIQIRGFPIRIPMDILIVYTANPEDYTNRGNIITPLRDRIASQINTHYPLTVEDGMKITEQEAWLSRNGSSVDIRIPGYFKEIIENIAVQARKSEYIDQKSGVSARLPITCMENLISNIEKRIIISPDDAPYPRICDLISVLPSVVGKIELVYEGEEEGAVNVSKMLIGSAVKEVFNKYFPEVYVRRSKSSEANEVYEWIKRWFSEGYTVELSDDLTDNEYYLSLDEVKGLKELAAKYMKLGDEEDKTEIATAMEFVLEGLHQHSVLSKDQVANHSSYGHFADSIFSSLGKDEGSDEYIDPDEFEY